MIKKPQYLIILLIIAVSVLFLAATHADQEMGILSLVSHAQKLWETSGHADKDAEAFRHWDEDGEVPNYCSKCHTTESYINFIENGAPITVAPEQEGITCEACHSDPESGTVRDHTDVKFPSGVVVKDMGSEALCMECHQGRESGLSIEEAIKEAKVEDDDTVSSSLEFINIHYYAAAATQFGTVVHAGYEYEDMGYDARFPHVFGYNACITCHDPHSLNVDLGPCNTCHVGIRDPHDLRYYGSFVDYDGDGDMEEGMYWELEDIKPKLYAALQAYCDEVAMAPIVYDSHAYPYFFHDTNGNGVADPSEAIYPNRYTSFTARSLKAAYNYQVSLKDPNAYAHGGKYVIQLLYDSIADLNSALDKPISMAGMHRGDEGHFDGSTEAWRHWDEDGEVANYCAKCHTTMGLKIYLENDGRIVDAQEMANGLLCTSCHFTGPPSLAPIKDVKFPSGAVKTLNDHSNYCMNCHQGRESMKSILEAISADPDGPYGFLNIHYYPTAAVMFGSEVKGGFEYQGKTYAGQNLFPNHGGKFDTCIECHMGTKSENKPYDYTGQMHNVEKPDPRDCVDCHGQDISQPKPGADPAKFKFSGIRPASIPDLNGNGDYTESIKDEIKALEKELYKYLQDEGNRIGKPIVYDSHAYPYFFNDSNGNGKVDPGENIYPNLYMFTAKMLKAAYNYQVSKKEPHGYIHNPIYIAQILIDSIVDLGGKASDYPWR